MQQKKLIAYVGIDYHKNTVTVAVIIEGTNEYYDTRHMTNDDKIIRKYMKKLSKKYNIKACYEASCNGYNFHRKMNDWGFHCEVIAPSLIPKKSGDKRKNDFRDARNLAKCYSNDDLTIVHPPTEEQESVRNFIRCRISLKENAKDAKLQINSFLLTQGESWTKTRWTQQHYTWLSQLKLKDDYSQQVLSEHLGHLQYLNTRIKNLDESIATIANSEIYASSVKKLKAFKGISTFSAMLLIAEITDFRRFPNPRALMAFLGLIPSENTSGTDRQKGGITKSGGITKTGNSRCRKQLIESVQHAMKKPGISSVMKKNLQEVDAGTANIAIKCMYRLHKRFWALVARGKNNNKAKSAIAREFVGFIWAMMTQPETVTE